MRVKQVPWLVLPVPLLCCARPSARCGNRRHATNACQGIYRYENARPVKGQPDSYDRKLIDALIEPYLDEAQAALAAGIVADAELVDAGLIFGTGFAPFRGGPLHYLKTIGKTS